MSVFRDQGAEWSVFRALFLHKDGTPVFNQKSRNPLTADRAEADDFPDRFDSIHGDVIQARESAVKGKLNVGCRSEASK